MINIEHLYYNVEPVCQEGGHDLSDGISLVATRATKGYQMPSGTVVLTEDEEGGKDTPQRTERVVIYIIFAQITDDESVDLIYLDPPFNSNRSYSHV
jgi:16S rRNA G966 N2-methylase RsmD